MSRIIPQVVRPLQVVTTRLHIKFRTLAPQNVGLMWTPAVDIATTAQATTIHTALVAALVAADLVETLSGETEYTVFAPSDEAFAAAGIDLDTFDTPEEIAVLSDILLYHVVAGTTQSTDLAVGANTVTERMV